MARVQYCDGESGAPIVSLTREQAAQCSHQGACDSDVAANLDLVEWHADDATLRRMLKGYGAWEDLGEASTDTLRSRALWLAAGDIVENPEQYQPEPPVDVLFRWESECGVYALFPSLPGTSDPHTCMSYQHTGQHSSADPVGCIRRSRPATPAEYADLLAELRRIGYTLRIVSRHTARHVEARRSALV